MALTLTYHPTSTWTVPVFPVYNDHTHLFTSTSSSRIGYRTNVGVYVNDIQVSTLSCFPFDNVIQANPAISKNYLLHNFNYDVARCVNNPDSIKKIKITAGESYSRLLSYSSITSGSGYFFTNVKLNFESTHNLTVNDRVYLVQDNQLINPQYNNYWKVIGINATQAELDCPYIYSQSRESGLCYDGVEFYDYHYNSSGNLVIQTTNPHNLNSGDTITLAMDTWSTGKLQLAGTGGTIQLFVNGVDIAGGPVNYATSIDNTLNNLAVAIALNYTSPDYSAFHESGSDIIHFYSERTSGDTTVGYNISAATTGLTAVYSPSMFKSHRIDANTGQGWNPQFSNVYQVKTITTPYEFELETSLIDGYSNQVGSERGSIISSNPFVFSASVTGNTYYIQNASNLYEYNSYSGEIATHRTGSSSAKFLTEQPRSNYNFYSLNDIATYDILYNTSGNTTGVNRLKNFVVKVYTATTSTIDYIVNVDDLLGSYTGDSVWRRISFGFGAWNLNKINSSFISPTPPSGGMIQENALRYDCYLLTEVFGTIVSETLSFNRECSVNKFHQIIFLNKFGAYDYFPVTGNFQNKLAIERSKFEKKRPRVISSAQYGIENDYRGNTVYNVDSTKKIKLFTNWLNLAESEWIEQVFESPEVYLYLPTESNSSTIDLNVLFPISLTDSEVVLPNENSKMKRLEFNAELSNKRINQAN